MTDVASRPQELSVLTAEHFGGLGTCRVLPEQTEGPFYLRADLVRRDITEGHEGRPLRVGLQVVDETCAPILGAIVDIWHADVDGDYSALTDGGTADDAAEGTTFLRGTQIAGEFGIVDFRTIYPGWYPGRAVHIHGKVHLEDSTVLTTQLYFDDELSATVFASGVYAGHGQPEVTNATDLIAGDPSAQGNLLFTTAEDAGDPDGLLALLVVGIDQAG